MHALIVEDDAGIAQFVEQGFREADYRVEVADTGGSGLAAALRRGHDVIVLDLMLPGRDGFSVLHELRQAGINTPVICLTARDSIDDRVRGLDLGADDYLVKPFSFAELMARVRAVLRRGAALANNTIVIADLTIDVAARRVERAGRRIELSAREFALLECLARAAGEVLPRSILLKRVWDVDFDPTTNVVDVHINRLRRKLETGFAAPLIHTVRGVGYRIGPEGT